MQFLDGSGQMKVFRYSKFVHQCIGRATDGTLVSHFCSLGVFSPFQFDFATSAASISCEDVPVSHPAPSAHVQLERLHVSAVPLVS